MGLPRSKYVEEGKEGVYHCFCRCVRRAFLYGFDKQTGQDFSHRKTWILDRLRQLASIFAIDVCAYSVMENHYHTILRMRPDIVERLSDEEVARRWLTLYPPKYRSKKQKKWSIDEQIYNLSLCSERIAELRKRLSNLSWFMKQQNEFIARAANKEDDVKGRFWESRFKCQALLDEAAIAACMVYVDLNPIRAGQAATPEESEFTSIQERIRAWYRETIDAGDVSGMEDRIIADDNLGIDTRTLGNENGISGSNQNHTSGGTRESYDNSVRSDSWLCSISSVGGHRGILSMTEIEYFELVDRTGRIIQPGKRGSMDQDLAAILTRIRANPGEWKETVSHFGEKFQLVAGLLGSIREFADLFGKHWFTGIKASQASFV
jgi:REP element-mobilizing transposase RayT